MGTRATYEWQPVAKEPKTFYIHYDGYPEGAILYLETAMHNSYKNHTHPMTEFGKLHGAEPSLRDAHGDTEYHYTMYFPPGESRLHVQWETRSYGEEWESMGDLPYGEFYRRFYNEV